MVSKAFTFRVLRLKQRFPKTFQDVCLFSEISYLLATYNYRLRARKFIEELFLDLKFIKVCVVLHYFCAIPAVLAIFIPINQLEPVVML